MDILYWLMDSGMEALELIKVHDRLGIVYDLNLDLILTMKPPSQHRKKIEPLKKD
jgi:hypothetical protein